ncbi:MAG: DUF3168 domain-containing protein [Rhizobiaceae bacterium]
MSAAASQLQKAVYQALAGGTALKALLGGPDIFDHTPPSASFPYVTFGQTSVFDWDTASEPGCEILFTIHIWSRAKGRGEVFAILDTVTGLLDEAALTVEGHHLVAIRFETAETGYDDDVAVHHGQARFRAILEPEA